MQRLAVINTYSLSSSVCAHGLAKNATVATLPAVRTAPYFATLFAAPSAAAAVVVLGFFAGGWFWFSAAKASWWSEKVR